MKTSYDFLPDYAKQDIKELVSLITSIVKDTEYIVLFGSYARNEFVAYDERIEFGIPTTFISDYDILVLTKDADVREVGRLLDRVDSIYYKRPENQVPTQFINDDINKFNSDVKAGRYFYTGILSEGIILYNANDAELESPQPLNYEEIAKQANEYYRDKMLKALKFYILSKDAYKRNWYEDAAFLLHQSAENIFYALRLVHTLKNNKQHNLYKLHRATCKYSKKLWHVFNFSDVNEKHLFEILKNAYVESRYNPEFSVNKEEIDLLYKKIRILGATAIEVIKDRIEDYESKNK